jgi:hypothetical protein
MVRTDLSSAVNALTVCARKLQKVSAWRYAMNNNNKGTEKKNFRDRVGDVVEKAGHKLSNAGMPAVGQKVHDLGDKIEKNHKNPAHPHKA